MRSPKRARPLTILSVCSVACLISHAALAQFISRGEWSPTETYQIDDLVTHRGSAWRGLDVSQDQMPGRTGANSTAPFWQLFTRGYNNAGAWDTSVKYHRDDIVTLGGSSWRAKQTSKGRKPDLINSAAHWEQVALGTLPRGVWDSATTYDLGDVVTFDGASFRAIRASGNSNREPSGPRLGTFWTLLAMRGAEGPVGAPGLDGAPGATGPQGSEGPQGSAGPEGPIGVAGADGAEGPAGPIGPVGPAGADGAVGAIGPQGPIGVAGADGATGPAGPTGPVGPAGADGAAGAVGPQGPVGVAGADGATGPVGPEGPAGPTGLAGATGPQGPAGAQGLQGPAGATGADGVSGPPGPAGPNTVAVGTVTAPSIKFTGDSDTGIFSPGANRIALSGGGVLFLHNKGDSNAALGEAALASNTVGEANAAVGYQALTSNTTGILNTALGERALRGNTTGESNTSLGSQTMRYSTTGSENTAVGAGALLGNSLGVRNTALGHGALEANGVGGRNVGVGAGAGRLANASSDSIFVSNDGAPSDTNTIKVGTEGTQTSTYVAGINGVTLANPIGVVIDTATGQLGVAPLVPGPAGPQGDTGPQGPVGPSGATGTQGPAGADGATGPQGPAGPNTVALGSVSAPSISFSGDTDTGIFSPGANKIALASGGQLFLHNNGTNNTALGSNALASNTTGYENEAVGSSALGLNTTGFYNTGVGRLALGANTNGLANSAIGFRAAVANTAGASNVAMGYYALASNSTGNENTAVGQQALVNSAGSRNTALGSFAGAQANAPEDSIFISNEGLDNDTQTIKIGTQGTQTSTFIAGIRGTATGNTDSVNVVIDSNGQLGTLNSSRRYKFDIKSMPDTRATLKKLRPVTFRYKKPYKDGSKPVQYGLIAEEVAKVMPRLAVYNAKGQPETVKYHLLPSLLLPAFQAQQRTIQKQAATIKSQADVNDAQTTALKIQAGQIKQLAKQLAAQKKQMTEVKALLASGVTPVIRVRQAVVGAR